MKCTTKVTQQRKKDGRKEEEKEQLDGNLQKLGEIVDLEATAAYSGALIRRRVVQHAIDLLRIVLMYSVNDYTLQQVGIWGTVMELGSLCKTAVRKRICHCRVWIGLLIVLLLARQNLRIQQRAGVRVRIFDATKLSGPGQSKGEWNLHVGMDLGLLSLDEVQLTDIHQGETLTRWTFRPGEICLADRYYGVPRSLGVLFAGLASFVIRIGWQNLPLQNRDGTPFDLIAWLRVQSTDPAATPAQALVWVQTPQGRFPLRLISRAIPPEKAMRKRANLRTQAKQQKRKLDERSLLAAGFVMVVSNLPELQWSATEILDLYRLRWQVELFFKRLKGILQLDHLRTHDPELAQVYLLAKVLSALMIGEIQFHFLDRNLQVLLNTHRPINHWRLTQWLTEAFRNWVRGDFSLARICQHLPSLSRYFSDGRRKRTHQWSQALIALDLFPVVPFSYA